jgi:hypothetical protein
VIWVSTPLLLALQYFGAEGDILPFKRNIKSFVAVVLILLFALPCLAYCLDLLGHRIIKLSERDGLRMHRRNEDSEANRPSKPMSPSRIHVPC